MDVSVLGTSRLDDSDCLRVCVYRRRNPIALATSLNADFHEIYTF